MASGKWFEYTLCEQMGNIGSEVSRAARWQSKDQKQFESAIYRAVELLDLPLSDVRWKGRYREIVRAKECVCDAFRETKRIILLLQNLKNIFTILRTRQEIL